MFNNKKAQRIFVGLMVGVMVFIVALILVKQVQEGVNTARNETNMNCTSAELSAVDNATCAVLDIGFVFYFISVLIAIGIAFVTGRRDITGVLTSITLFVVVVVLITPLKSLIILFRDADHLNCASSAITVGANMTCLVVDLWLFWFVAITLASAFTYIFVTKLRSQ